MDLVLSVSQFVRCEISGFHGGEYEYVFWDVGPCRLDDGGSKHIRNVGQFMKLHGATSQKTLIFYSYVGLKMMEFLMALSKSAQR
jgi:hypothetical protein